MKTLLLSMCLVTSYVQCNFCRCKRNSTFADMQFPEGFIFGTVSSAYQIEGAWNVDGKGESLWDHFSHTSPANISGGRNGDIAALSYYKYVEDIQLIKRLCFTHYRLSIAWTRILPNGDLNNINQKGIRHYKKVIHAIVAHGLVPMVTMYHYNMPQALQDKGGWLNRSLINDLTGFADILFKNFGDKVKIWFTINQPIIMANAYSMTNYFPPGLGGHGKLDYIAAHTMLLAHASVYRLYERKYKTTQKGAVSILISSQYGFPKTDSAADIAAGERYNQFYTGWFAHPIYSQEGDYPQVMRQRIDKNSAEEGLKESRLPRFTKQEVEFIRGTSDFYALNYYTSMVCKNGTTGQMPSLERDSGVISMFDQSWPSTAANFIYVIPEGLTKILGWIRREYKNPTIFLTENGYPTLKQQSPPFPDNENKRINYFKDHLLAVLQGIKEGSNVIGYLFYSFMDAYEWLNAYRIGFGFVGVDFNDPARRRTKRKSADYIQSFIQDQKCSRTC